MSQLWPSAALNPTHCHGTHRTFSFPQMLIKPYNRLNEHHRNNHIGSMYYYYWLWLPLPSTTSPSSTSLRIYSKHMIHAIFTRFILWDEGLRDKIVWKLAAKVTHPLCRADKWECVHDCGASVLTRTLPLAKSQSAELITHTHTHRYSRNVGMYEWKKYEVKKKSTTTTIICIAGNRKRWTTFNGMNCYAFCSALTAYRAKRWFPSLIGRLNGARTHLMESL